MLEVLSCGALNQWGKTEHSTQRRTVIPSILREDLTAWRAALVQAGRPTREYDVIIPGDLADTRYGVQEPHTGACHISASQAKGWGTKYFTPPSRGLPNDRSSL